MSTMHVKKVEQGQTYRYPCIFGAVVFHDASTLVRRTRYQLPDICDMKTQGCSGVRTFDSSV